MVNDKSLITMILIMFERFWDFITYDTKKVDVIRWNYLFVVELGGGTWWWNYWNYLSVREFI